MILEHLETDWMSSLWHAHLDICVCANDRSEAAHGHAKDRVARVHVRHAAAHGGRERGALETKRPHHACRIKVEDVEYVAEVEPGCLHSELNMIAGEHWKMLDILLPDSEVVDGAWACEIELERLRW